MSQGRLTEFRVGVFVIIALAIGAALSFVIGSQQSLFSAKTDFRAVFDSVGGLRAGSPVRIGGVDVGTVSNVELIRDGEFAGKIEVTVGVVNSAVPLVRADSEAIVGAKGLLGDKMISITVGTTDPLEPGGTLRSGVSGDVMASAQELMARVDETITEIREDLIDEQFTEDIKNIVHNISVISDYAAVEGGLVDRVFTDPSYGDIIAGTLGNLSDASEEFVRIANNANLILSEIRAGDGTAHELIYGRSGVRLLENLAEATSEVALMLEEVRTGDGMVHELVYEGAGTEILANLNATTAEIREIVEGVGEGRGTIGGLLVDPSIYEDVKRLIGDLERNEILRALVRYSIRFDESEGDVDVEPEE